MRAACLLSFLLLLIVPGAGKAQTQGYSESVKQPRILIVLDGSAAMLQSGKEGLNRFTIAAGIISALMDSVYAVNSSVAFGLRVYGHQSAEVGNECYDTRKEVMFSRNNATQMALRLAAIRPAGFSSVAYALQEAAGNDLVDEARNAYGVVLITGAGESCGGDLCGAVRKMIAARSYVSPYVISLTDDASVRQQYSCLGNYFQVNAAEDIVPAIDTMMAVYRPWLSVPWMAATGEHIIMQKQKTAQQQVSDPLRQIWMPPPVIAFEPLPAMQRHSLPAGPHPYLPPRTVYTQMPVLPRQKAPAAGTRNILRFVYAGTTGRPAAGFEALLHIQSEPGAALSQSTESAFPYTRGVYYLEVNTLPPMRRNITLDTGAVTVAISQPGIIRITNELPLGKVSFFSPLAGRYVRFFDLEITGRPGEQQARFQPGNYEAHWNRKSADGKAAEVVTRFSVTSNQTTRLELR